MSKATIFLSYNYRDEANKNTVVAHLKVLQRVGLVDLWCHSQGALGPETPAVEAAIEQARLAILLITGNYLHSEFLPVGYISRLIERARDNEMTIFAIILENCGWRQSEWLAQLNIRPANQKPVWRDNGKFVDEELTTIVEEIAERLEPDIFSGPVRKIPADMNAGRNNGSQHAALSSLTMDYERGLDLLKAQLEQTNRYIEFTTLEARMRENMQDEHMFGSSETTRTERARIVSSLNKLAIDVLQSSFNDLALGKTITNGATTTDLSMVKQLDVTLSPDTVTPPVKSQLHELPFNDLSWEQFEALCAALVEAQPVTLDTHLYGVQGDDQQGIDIVATQRGADKKEIWAYQCKRYKEYTAAKLKDAVAKMSYPADYYVLMLSIPATAAVRQVSDENPNLFLWDARDIARKLKNYPLLVEDFFGRVWREAFCPESLSVSV
jgi:hypothetical protein